MLTVLNYTIHDQNMKIPTMPSRYEFVQSSQHTWSFLELSNSIRYAAARNMEPHPSVASLIH